MIAEIYHKTTNYQEDELTGNFFGNMRYLPFSRGLNQIFKKYVISEDPYVQNVLSKITEDRFEFKFWKRSGKGYGEIDGYIAVANVGIGIEVKYQSGLSGEDQLEREAAMVQEEWCKNGDKLLIFVADEEDVNPVYQRNKMKPIFKDVHLGYITWQNILMGLDDVVTTTEYEELIIKDLERLLVEKGFVAFKGFEIGDVTVKGDVFYDYEREYS